MSWVPCLTRSSRSSQLEQVTVGHPVVDDYLVFVGARLRLNSWVAVAYDLKVFFSIVDKEPAAVTTTDVLSFIKAQRAPRRAPNVVRLDDGGLSYFFSARGQRLTESKPSWSAGSGGCGEDVEQDVGEFLGLQRR